jgi:hypothetical protein
MASINNKDYNAMKGSLHAFYGSKNCDKSSPENFYKSYIARKKIILDRKRNSLSGNGMLNQKKLDWQMRITSLVLLHKQTALEIIETLMADFNPSLNGGRSTSSIEDLLSQIDSEL